MAKFNEFMWKTIERKKQFKEFTDYYSRVKPDESGIDLEYRIGKRVLDYIKSNSLSVTTFASKLEVNPRTVFNWITGKSIPCSKTYITLFELDNKQFPLFLKYHFKPVKVYICKNCCGPIASKLNTEAWKIIDNYCAPYTIRNTKGITIECWNCKIPNQ